MGIFKTSDGALFVQPEGPNTQPRFVGCVDVDQLSEPGGAIDTLIRCFKPDGSGWYTLDSTVTPPDPVTTTITTIVEGAANYLEQLESGVATLFIHQRADGRADTFGNYDRSWVLEKAYIGEKTASDLIMREEDNPSTMGFGISAMPPVYRVFKKMTGRLSSGTAEAINGIHFVSAKIGFAVNDALSGSPSDKAGVYYTTNKGVTWTAAAALPFAGAENIAAVTAFYIGRSTVRVVVARGTTDAGNPMEIAYSDDYGATWSTVNVGSTNGQFAKGPHALYAAGPYAMWLVVDDGYIYHSSDGGITWSTQSSGGATSEDLVCVHFVSEKVGYAGGLNDAIVKTEDGGVSWTATTGDTNSSADILDLHVIDADHVWVGTDDGEIFYTEDGGITWTERAFSGSGTGDIKALKFLDGSSLFGFMLHNSASPVGTVKVTIDGGYTWESITTFTNSGLNDIFIMDENTAYFAGEVQGSTGVLGKLQAKQ